MALDFCKRLQKFTSHLLQRINSPMEMNQETKLVFLRPYEEMSLTTVMRNLIGSLQTTIRLKQPDFLNPSLSYIIGEQNLTYTLIPSNCQCKIPIFHGERSIIK